MPTACTPASDGSVAHARRRGRECSRAETMGAGEGLRRHRFRRVDRHRLGLCGRMQRAAAVCTPAGLVAHGRGFPSLPICRSGRCRRLSSAGLRGDGRRRSHGACQCGKVRGLRHWLALLLSGSRARWPLRPLPLGMSDLCGRGRGRHRRPGGAVAGVAVVVGAGVGIGLCLRRCCGLYGAGL